MTGYWIRHRVILSIVMSAVTALMSGLLFVFPFVSQTAEYYNSQSIYKNSDIDFIAPEPSFEQVSELPGSNGIDKVFPYFLTKTSVNVGGKSRTTTVLLSDNPKNTDITMYNDRRLIKKSDTDFDNPILADWQFCKDTSTDIGDTVSFTIGDNTAEYRIYAIYETNSIYENGAIFAPISSELKDAIALKSRNSGYSGMYISASDYNTCLAYLTKDYRPLGRLKDRSQFDSDEQYQIHYNAIMESGYANEITDFRIRENSLDKKVNSLIIWIGAALSCVLIIAFNVIMSKRGGEKGYFTKYCIPKGLTVKPYYTKSFICELLCFGIFYAAALLLKFKFSEIYIPKSAFGIEIAVIPTAVIVAEIICLSMNYALIKHIIISEKSKAKKNNGSTGEVG